MPFLKRSGAEIYYEDTEAGTVPLIAVHGLIENTAYWTRTGLAERLAAEGYRVVAMDMRGHGRTITQTEPAGYDAETIGKDIEALADSCHFGRFYLLAHSTGGFAASRWAMQNDHRLAGLMLTDSSSATSPVAGNSLERWEFFDRFAAGFENRTWDEIIEYTQKHPFPFFRGIAEADDNEQMWQLAREIISSGNRRTIAAFIRSFYQDPDLQVEKLKKLACPVLLLVGEKDDLFIEPAETMAAVIPNCRHVVLPGVGHMTAIEAPARLAEELLSFMGAHPM